MKYLYCQSSLFEANQCVLCSQSNIVALSMKQLYSSNQKHYVSMNVFQWNLCNETYPMNSINQCLPTRDITTIWSVLWAWESPRIILDHGGNPKMKWLRSVTCVLYISPVYTHMYVAIYVEARKHQTWPLLLMQMVNLSLIPEALMWRIGYPRDTRYSTWH